MDYMIVQDNPMVRIIKFPTTKVGTTHQYAVQQKSPRGGWIYDTDYCSWKKARSVYKTLTDTYKKTGLIK